MMIKTIAQFISIGLTALLLTGCGPAKRKVDENYSVIKRITPKPPAVLHYNERLNIQVKYNAPKCNICSVFMQPRLEGKPVPHAMISISKPFKKAAGTAEYWITFTNDASIDAISFTMRDFETRFEVDSYTQAVEAIWISK